MNDLLENVYLPDLDKRNIRESDAYKLLEENKMDTSILEGHESSNQKAKHYDNQVIMEGFDNFISQGGNKVDWINKHATPEVQAEYFSNIGDFIVDTGKDTVLSLATAVVNGADVATNLMPLFVKALDKMPNLNPMMIGQDSSMSVETEKQVYDFANNVSNKLGEARDYLNEFKKDDNFASQLIGVMSQDLLYSVPIYNNLRKAGVPKYWAFLISGGVGGAIGIEDKIMGAESTFSQQFFEKDIVALKNLIGIVPNTPEDKIADEVVQALEYGAFSVAIPAIIDAFKFGKRFIPAMTSTGVGTTALTIDNEAEGSPIKAIVNAIDNIPMFKSAVIDAADKIPAVASGDQIFNTIKNTTGVKESELKWMDLEGFLKNKKKVSKEEVLEYINANKIDVTEVKLSNDLTTSELPNNVKMDIDDYENRWLENEMKVLNSSDPTIAPENRLSRPFSAEERVALLDNNLNYDQYKIRYTEYSGKINAKVGEDISSDWSSSNRNPLIQAMDEMADMVGYGVPWRNIEVRLTPWEDMNTGKYTGHVIEVDKGAFHQNTSYYKVSSPAYEGAAERYIVSSNSLEALTDQGQKFKKISTYEMDKLELEKFNLEDKIRNFNKYRMDKGNNTLFEKYTVAGGDDYTELVFKIKNKDGDIPAVLEGEFGTLAGNKMKTSSKTTIDYRNPHHFNQSSEFANVRFKTRLLPNGKKVLVVEEMQSDLLMASKTEMFASSNSQLRRWNDRDGAPYADKVLKDFPFRNTWYEFTIKRLTRYATDNGFDAIAIPKGNLAANRYSKDILKIKSIDVEPMAINKMESEVDFDGVANSKGFFIRLNDEAGEKIFERTIYGVPGDDNFFANFKDLSKDVGESNLVEIQQLILQADETDKIAKKLFEKTQIEGAGKGKYHLYNQTIPGYMKKYAKKWNAKVYDESFSIDDVNIDSEFKPDRMKEMPVTILELSPEMKTGVTKSSQPLFEIFGTVSLSTWAANEVSDSMENNSISQTTN